MLESMLYLHAFNVHDQEKRQQKNHSWVIWETGTCLGLKDVSESILHFEGLIRGILWATTHEVPLLACGFFKGL